MCFISNASSLGVGLHASSVNASIVGRFSFKIQPNNLAHSNNLCMSQNLGERLLEVLQFC